MQTRSKSRREAPQTGTSRHGNSECLLREGGHAFLVRCHPAGQPHGQRPRLVPSCTAGTAPRAAVRQAQGACWRPASQPAANHIRMRSSFVLSAQPPERCLDLASGATHSARTRTTRGNWSPSCNSLDVPCGLQAGAGAAGGRLRWV